MKVSRRLTRVAAVALTAAAITAVPMSRAAFASHSYASSQITGSVGFLFSDFTTSQRWQFDRSYFISDLLKLDPKVKVIVRDAHAAQTNQQNQAKSLLTLGVKALIDVPVDSGQAGAIIKAAHANKPRVKVLAYDRLITGAYEDAYASFNGYNVGVQQGRWIASHVKSGGTIIEIAGASTDNNAHLFSQGAHSVLDPLISSGKLHLGYSKFTPNWDGATAQQECASALNSLKNNVNGVLVANDNMAVYCITALKAQGLAGKIPVTGQDAQVSGLQQILLGNQSMTVYKPIKNLALASARIVDTWLHGKVWRSSVKTPIPGIGKTPSFLAPVVTVTKYNMRQTVLKDGYVKRADLCKGIEAACRAAGI
jgi:D-xylose transport system substrate-binding protein